MPDGLSLMSKYELICYFAVLCLTCFLLIKWHSIPQRSFDIEMERLSQNKDNNSSCLDLSIRIPMSYVAANKDDGNIKVEFITTEKQAHELYAIVLFENTRDKLIDSLKNVVSEQYPDIKPFDLKYSIFYYKETRRLPMSNQYLRLNSEFNKDDSALLKKERIAYRKTILSHRQLTSELFISEYLPATLNENAHIGSTGITRPKWYSLYDISQSYFNVIIHTYTIDSLNATFDFVGATDFYEFDNTLHSSKITASKIEYQCPIQHMDNEIKLYLRFKDLENIQTVRIVVVSAILGGLVTIFLAFIIIFIYRLYRYHKLNSIKPQEENSEEITK